jgi:TonB family protein
MTNSDRCAPQWYRAAPRRGARRVIGSHRVKGRWGVRRGAVAASVVAGHAVLTAAFWENRIGLPNGREQQSVTARLIAPNPEVPPAVLPIVRQVAIRLTLPTLIPIPIITGPDPVGVRGVKDDQTHPSSPPFERLIVEAAPQDADLIREFCDRNYPDVSRTLNEYGTVVLMIRVETDGHVSDSKVEESSGSTRLDEAARICVAGVGLFEPHHSGVRPVATWQRTRWTWSPAG